MFDNIALFFTKFYQKPCAEKNTKLISRTIRNLAFKFILVNLSPICLTVLSKILYKTVPKQNFDQHPLKIIKQVWSWDFIGHFTTHPQTSFTFKNLFISYCIYNNKNCQLVTQKLSSKKCAKIISDAKISLRPFDLNFSMIWDLDLKKLSQACNKHAPRCQLCFTVSNKTDLLKC